MGRIVSAFVLALVITLATVMVPPLLSLQPDMTEQGFPLPWLFKPDYPTDLWFIGFFFQTAEAVGTRFSVEGFVFDFLFFFVLLVSAARLVLGAEGRRSR